MMLSAVPEWNDPVVTTTGSQMSMFRVTNVSIATTISHAAGIGSFAKCGAEPWPPTPLNGHAQRVARGHERAAPRGEPAQLVVGRDDVDRVSRHRTLAGRLQQPFGDHRLGAAWTFLARLEHEDDVSGQVCLACREQPSRADQEGHVHVVSARLHGAGHLGRERQIGQLLHRQPIHVTPQQHCRSGLARRAARRRPTTGHGPW